MARKRMIDPGIWQSEDFSKLSTLAKLVFIGIFSNADDEGRGRGKASYIKSVLFPYDEGMRVIDVDKALSEIAHNMSVTFYLHDENEYYSLDKWCKWQKIDRASDSVLPPPDDMSTIIRRTLDEESTNARRALAPNRKEVNRKEVNRKEENINIGDFFEKIWAAYPRKYGKGKISDAKKRELYAIGDELFRCIERYSESCEGKEEKYIMHGSTFFNSGYVDFLDANYTPAKGKNTNNQFLKLLSELEPET